jgi:SAM-dependent methyltransferase
MPEPDAASARPFGTHPPGRAETALLHDLTCWQEQLARSIARNNLGMRSGSIATAVNRILLALLFLRVAEDRGLIGTATLRSLQGSASSCSLQAILRNSRWLSDEDTAANQGAAEEFLDLVVDEEILHSILSALTAAERHYDLRVMPTEILSQVLLRYLERTVRRSAAHQVIMVDTHDTTQSGGTAAAPLPALGYLVKSSLAAARAGRSHREILPLRVLDPACGAGTALLMAYQDLLDNSPGGIPGPDERREILLQSVHGLDINPHAVAVTRMLLVFRLAEISGSGTMPADFLAFSEEMFRNLRHNIRSGNALIGPEIERDESWMFCPARDRHALLPFSWQQGFPEISAAGGFDAVISNPPEGSLERREWIQQYFQRHYAVYHPRVDRSAYFLEKSLSLARPGGIVASLTSSRWLRGAGGSRLREVLKMWQIEEIVDFSGIPADSEGAGLCILRVRTTPPVRPVLATNAGPLFFMNPATFVSTHRFPVNHKMLDEGGWQLRDTRAEAILRRVSHHSSALENFVMGQVHTGIPVPADDPFLIAERQAREWLRRDPACKPLLRELVEGAGIGHYCSEPAKKFVLLIPRGWTARRMKGAQEPWQWLKRRHPLVARHLQPASELLKARAGPSELWWESGFDEFWQETQKKILFPARFRSPAFLYDPGRALGNETTMAIPSPGLYLPGILNSRFIAFVFEYSIRQSAHGRQWFSWDDLKTLPIYTPDFDRLEDRARHGRMEHLVQRRIGLQKNRQGARDDRERGLFQKKIHAADRQIDALVYELYGLTPEEIAFVESASLS